MKPVLALLTLCLCLGGCGEKSTPPTNGDDPAPATKPPVEPRQTTDTSPIPPPEPQAEPTEAEKKEFAETKAKAGKGDPVAQVRLGATYKHGIVFQVNLDSKKTHQVGP